jgi:tetratricopeptide (TPR) repeat protein
MDRIEKIKELLKMGGRDSFLFHALALEHIKLGNDEEALKCFTNVLSHDPDYVGSYYHLGKLYERSGKKEEALSTYRKGKVVAQKAQDRHSWNELNAALDELDD